MARLVFLPQPMKRVFENYAKFKYKKTKIHVGASDFLTMKLNTPTSNKKGEIEARI